MNAVDANILVHAFDSGESIKHPLAIALLDQLTLPPMETVLLWQVAGEFLQCLRKWESAGRMHTADVEAHFQDVTAMFPLRMPTVASLMQSFVLRARYPLSHWDSMLLASCHEAGVDRLYSEDMGHGMIYNSVSIINPFL